MRVGLTGGIGSGKTMVCRLFAELGVPVIDADRISHDLTRRGGTAFQAVADLFGPDALDATGALRRDHIREQVFRDSNLRRQLEQIIHPLVHAEMEREIADVRYPYCIVCIPLLLETHGQQAVDRILVVDAPERLQVERVTRRDGAPVETVERILHSQSSRQARIRAADDLISNDRDEDHVREQVGRLHGTYLGLAREYVETSA